MTTVQYAVTCHCGAAAQTVTSAPLPKAGEETEELGINLCHCKPCRHNTGLLCISSRRLGRPPLLRGLKLYDTTSRLHRYFCETCGCHMFYRYEGVDRDGEAQVMWTVSTGVITGRASEDGNESPDEDDPVEPQHIRHIRISSTLDGGLSPWIGEVAGRKMEVYQDIEPGEPAAAAPGGPVDGAEARLLQAFCHCGTVRFHISRPDDASRAPRSNFADLIVPYHTGSPRVANPDDEKWWLRPAGAGRPARYLAGTCACRSCRLISGFEIQTWAFVPRTNIFFHVGAATSDPEDTVSGEAYDVEYVPLDFATLPSGILKSYESSPGVLRESCPKCGATVFWHDKWRPDLIDVSVGLLDAPEGARAEDWLEWWTGRVSFAEDAGTGRSGAVGERARSLIEGLGYGLRR